MDGVVFLAVIACLALVLVWYFRNEEARADGKHSLLAVLSEDDPDADEETRAYRLKERRTSAGRRRKRARRAKGREPRSLS